MAAKDANRFCGANVGTRTQPRRCGAPVAPRMLAACRAHKTTLIPYETAKGKREPGIYSRGGRYVVVTVYRGRQVKSFHDTITLAREARSDRTGTVKQAPRAREPFDTYALAWIDSYQGRGKRGVDPDTRAGYKRALELWAIPHFRATPLRDIDRTDIEALVAKMQREGLSPASIEAYMAPVRRMFSLLVAKGQLPTNPATALDIDTKAKPKQPRKRAKSLTRAELSALIAAVPQGRDRTFFELIAATGMRVSEACGLDCEDLGQDGRTITIQRQHYRGSLKDYTKSKNGQRTISLPPELGRRLWAAYADQTGSMFATKAGLRLSSRHMSRVLARAAEVGGVPHASPHTLRHAHGSMLLDRGWPITDVAHRLGDDVATVQAVYAHKLKDSDRDLSFLDVGNAWASEDPQASANPVPIDSAEMSA